jgi:hypothetical protein
LPAITAPFDLEAQVGALHPLVGRAGRRQLDPVPQIEIAPPSFVRHAQLRAGNVVFRAVNERPERPPPPFAVEMLASRQWDGQASLKPPQSHYKATPKSKRASQEL